MTGTCGNCIYRIGEECWVTGNKVYNDTVKTCCKPKEHSNQEG